MKRLQYAAIVLSCALPFVINAAAPEAGDRAEPSEENCAHLIAHDTGANAVTTCRYDWGAEGELVVKYKEIGAYLMGFTTAIEKDDAHKMVMVEQLINKKPAIDKESPDEFWADDFEINPEKRQLITSHKAGKRTIHRSIYSYRNSTFRLMRVEKIVSDKTKENVKPKTKTTLIYKRKS